jgi:uncharacterized protein YecT (DUF1311 family)
MRPVWIAVATGIAAGQAVAGAGAAPGAGAGLHSTTVAIQPAPSSGPTHLSGQSPPSAPGVKPATPTDPIVARYSADYEGCMRKAGSTLDMVACADHENDRWDARMTRALQSRLANFSDRQRAALKRAQKAWTEFRDADCAAYEGEEAGSISRVDASQCALRRTVERTLELEAFPADHGPG